MKNTNIDKATARPLTREEQFARDENERTIAERHISNLKQTAVAAALYGNERSHNQLSDAAHWIEKCQRERYASKSEHAALAACEVLVLRLDSICKRGGDIQLGPKGRENDLRAQIDSALASLAAVREGGAK